MFGLQEPLYFKQEWQACLGWFMGGEAVHFCICVHEMEEIIESKRGADIVCKKKFNLTIDRDMKNAIYGKYKIGKADYRTKTPFSWGWVQKLKNRYMYTHVLKHKWYI